MDATGSSETLTSPVEDFCEFREIGHRIAVGTNPRKVAGCSREGEIGGKLTHFLQEREEVGAVLGADGVATDALPARVLPAGRG